MTYNDQSNQNVGTQYNAENIIFNPPKQHPSILLEQGIKLLEAKYYQQAIDKFKAVIEADYSMNDAYYYLALALLKGRRPKILIREEIEEIDQILNVATIMGYSDGTVLWFRALIKDDYYNSNRITNYPPPFVKDIVTTALSCNINLDNLRTLLAKLPMADNPLYVALINQFV